MFKDLKMLLRARKALGRWRRGLKEGRKLMDKPAVASWTMWGAALVALSAVILAVGKIMTGELAFMEALPLLAEKIGYAIAIIGGRRVAGAIINGK